jgi:hypothetical protein
MDTYILRIYRRGPAGSGSLHGTVERVGARARAAFSSRDELWASLERPAADGAQPPGSPYLDAHDRNGGNDVAPEK